MRGMAFRWGVDTEQGPESGRLGSGACYQPTRVTLENTMSLNHLEKWVVDNS